MNRLIAVLMVVMAAPALADIEIQTVEAAGLKALLVEDYHVSAVNMVLAFSDAGYASDPADKQGRAQLAASLLMEGTQTLDEIAFIEALEDKAIRLNIALERDMLSVNVQTLSEHVGDAFALMTDALLNPALRSEALKRQKSKMDAARKSQQESPYYLAARAFREAAYAGHPYSNEQLGSDASVAALDEAALRDYLVRHITKDNAVMAVVGAISADELTALLETHLADLPQPFAPDVKAQNVQITATGEHRIIKKLPQSVIMFGAQGIERRDERFYAGYVLNHIVGGGSLTSILGKAIRKERGLTYGVNTDLNPMLHAASWGGAFATKNDTAAEAREVLRDTLAATLREGISQEQCDQAKQYIIGSYPLNLDSNASVASYLLSIQLYDLGVDYLEARNDYFKRVTCEQVNGLSQELLDPAQLIVVSVGNEPTPDVDDVKP